MLEVEKQFCVYLDLLGFSESIKLNKTKLESSTHLNQIYTIFSEATKSIKYETDLDINSGYREGTDKWKFKIFSDNVLIAYPFESKYSTHPESLLIRLLTEIMEFQIHLTFHGFFVRGAISLGELFIDENIIYGKALVEAVDLEKQACFPRIILSNDCKNIIPECLEDYNDIKLSQLYDRLLIDNNSVFINYLSYLTPDKKNLLRHKEIIEEKIKEFEEEKDNNELNKKILTKYLWVAEYHNFWAKEIDAVGECFIQRELTKFSFERIKK